MLSPSLEDYLEEVYRLSLKGGNIRVSDVADCLEVSLPSVVKALRKLDKEEYLFYRAYQPITLTVRGNEVGSFLVERNRILRQFLQVIGSSCDAVAEAEAMEHYLSLPTIKSIKNLVDFMESNPDYLKVYRNFCQMDK